MHNDKSSKARVVFRKIAMKDVKILCRYHFSKGVKPIDFQIVENEESQKQCVIGIGDSGIEIVQKNIKNNSNYFFLMADISHRNLNNIDAEHKLYLMSDVKDKEMLTIENRRILSEFVRAHKKVFIVTRLDNELNMCNVVEKIVQHLHRINREVVLIAIKPFLFELPPWRLDRVNATLKSFEKYVHKLIVFDSEDLLGIKEASNLSIKEYFRFFDSTIAKLIEGVCEIGEEKVVNVSLIELFNQESD
jgi:cell division GTPase FtsZ